MSKLSKAYQRLNIQVYTEIIKDTLIPYYDAFDGEYITTLSPSTIFTIAKHYSPEDGAALGWNIYANGVLLETKSSLRKAKKFLKKLCK